MSVFLVLLVCGLLGLGVMTLPGLFQAHSAMGGGHGAGHGMGHAHGHAGHPVSGPAHFIPAPRTVFAFVALFGAFGNVAEHWLRLPFWVAALAAVLPAYAVERLALRPLWGLALKFQGTPSSPLEHLIAEPAHAVTPFRNGKGLVAVTRDGRTVQLSAELVPAQHAEPVRVGDSLQIEDVEAGTERVTVSIR